MTPSSTTPALTTPAPTTPVLALAPGAAPEPTILQALDKLLDKGVALDGQIVISLGGVDLVYIGLRALLASVETAGRCLGAGR
jgi:hypothetical protein